MHTQFNQIRSGYNTLVAGASDAEEIDRMLSVDSNRSSTERNWPRLDNTERVALLKQYAESYCREKELGEAAANALTSLLEEAVRCKKLSKVRDVVYDKGAQKVISIPGLEFDHETGRGRIIRVKSKKSEKK